MALPVSVWAIVIPDPVYFNDFSSPEGLTIVGSGSFAVDEDANFGKYFQNETSASPRQNYLLLPSTVFGDFSPENAKTAMTIQFWVKHTGEPNMYTYAPLLGAYGKSTAENIADGHIGNIENWPVLILQNGGTLQVNNNGWCDFNPAQNATHKNTIYNSTDWHLTNDVNLIDGGCWLADKQWHLYTVTFTATQCVIYLDGVAKNTWNVDGVSEGQIVSGFLSNAQNHQYVCLGGNQAWGWSDNDAAFAFDDFAVYDVALSIEQIKQIKETKLPTIRTDENGIILFEDPAVKTLCVENWDTNGDGELSVEEAAAVTDLGTVFKGNETITSFDELQFFIGLTSIGEQAFDYCSRLTSITIPNSVTCIGKKAFMNCHSLPSITIPNNVKTIESYAFCGCWDLISIIIPDGVKTIDLYTFQNCLNLSAITIPNSVTWIRNYAFAYCLKLSAITIPKRVEGFGSNAFQGCSNLVAVKMENSTPVTIVEDVFPNRANVTLYVPYGSKALYEAASFWQDFGTIIESNIETNSIVFADINVKHICLENWDTDDDGELSLEEAAAVTDLGAIFKSSRKITSFDELQFLTGLTSIGDQAFYGCTNLTSITIPSNVTSIGNQAFRGCYSLSSINIPSNVTSMGEYSFLDCVGLESISVESDNPIYDSRDNCNAIILKADNTLVVGCKTTVIPSSVTIIGNYAFSGCTGLTSISIPNSVTKIGNYAFSNCSGLSSITIPNSVTLIGLNSFRSCSGIESITVENDNPIYDSRDNCNAIIQKADNLLYIGCQNTVIPNSVTGIITNAFCGCANLTSITIPNSVTYIGMGAFDNCNNLAVVKMENHTPVVASSPGMANRANAMLYVPHGSKAAYETASFWQDFGTIVEYTTLDENSITAPEAANGVEVTVRRTINVGEWSTISLPFAMSQAQCQAAFGNDVQIGDFTGYTYNSDEDRLTVNFSSVTAIEANHPYIIKVSAAVTEFTVNNVDIVPTVEPKVNFGTTDAPNAMIGNYVAKTKIGNGNLFLKDNNLWYSVGNTEIKAFRAYFSFADKLADFSDNYATSRIMLSFGGQTTGVSEAAYLNNKEECIKKSEMFNLNGQRVTSPRKGLYILNGKIVFIK